VILVKGLSKVKAGPDGRKILGKRGDRKIASKLGREGPRLSVKKKKRGLSSVGKKESYRRKRWPRY